MELGHGRMPIHIAADFGQTTMLAKLIAKGADINVRVFAHMYCIGQR